MYKVTSIMLKVPNEFDIKKLKYNTKHLSCKTCSKISGITNMSDYFVELTCDDETLIFINNCLNSNYQLFKATYIRPWITMFFNLTESNAILGTGKMFLLSKDHIKILFNGYTFKNMLDIGAGDGNVTEQFTSFIRGGGITCTETAANMIKVLKTKGYSIQDDISGEYELVTCLNVLDRCDKPITILKEILKVKKRFAMLSIVLPFKGFYNSGKKQCKQLEEVIGCFKEWEESVHRLSKLFIELGFKIEKISRIPYLSEGDFRQEMYYLDTVIFILSN